MAVKMILLKTGDNIISGIKEITQDEKIHGYFLEQPHSIRTQEKTLLMESETSDSNYELDVILSPWMILSSDKEYVISPDIVATICEPLSSVKDMYDRKLKINSESESETEVEDG